jgi:trehalose 6-phosphate phosphatase
MIQAKRVWLFLDYDGTLADFEPTPAVINPDPALAILLTHLTGCPGLRLAVISGRQLVHLRALLPVAGMWLAGTYGAEWLTPQDGLIERLDKNKIRPSLDAIKTEWEKLIAGDTRFYLEDKGLALALHAKYVEDHQAAKTLAIARQIIQRFSRPGLSHILDGHKFLEVAPVISDKSQAVKYILDTYPWPDASLIYLGDDDKDEAAFETVRSLGGVSILVSEKRRDTNADCILESPQQVRQWLEHIVQGRAVPG